MNDFMKQELECLENAIQLQLAEKPMSQINYDRRVDIRQKLQSMIDSYCEHEMLESASNPKCTQCGVYQ